VIALLTVAIELLWRSLLGDQELIFYLAESVTGTVAFIWAGSIVYKRKR
jgi:hypothetical protein